MTEKNYDNYDLLSQHPFVADILEEGMAIRKKHGGISIRKSEEHTYSEGEYYCLQLSFCVVHLLTVIQQMEHTVLYMSNFSPTELMKKSGINRGTHLLWSVENYIIRTQSVYDRLLVLIDRLFHIQNQPNRISHESIVTNAHISRTEIPNALKPVRASIKKYYHDRNTIIHESSYLDDEIRRIEMLTIAVTSPGYAELDKDRLNEDLKWEVRVFVKKRKREFQRINKNTSISLSGLLSL